MACSMSKGLSLFGFAMFNMTADEQGECAEDMNRWLAAKKLKAIIGKRFPLAETAAAHQTAGKQHSAQGRHPHRKDRHSANILTAISVESARQFNRERCDVRVATEGGPYRRIGSGRGRPLWRPGELNRGGSMSARSTNLFGALLAVLLTWGIAEAQSARAIVAKSNSPAATFCSRPANGNVYTVLPDKCDLFSGDLYRQPSRRHTFFEKRSGHGEVAGGLRCQVSAADPRNRT